MLIKRKKPTPFVVKRKTGIVKEPSTGVKMLKPTKVVSVEAVIEQWDLHQHGVTQGFLANWLSCQERVRLSHKEMLHQERGSFASEFGNIIHTVNERLYGSGKAKDLYKVMGDYEKETKAAAKKGKAGISTVQLQELEEQWAMAWGVMPSYVQKWEEDFSQVEWIALEEVFEVNVEIIIDDFVHNILVRGKWDGVFRTLVAKRLRLFETKTKGQVKEDSLMDRLVIDLQVMLYLWAIWKTYGEVPGGVTYNIIRRPQLRRGKSETLKQFTERIWKDVATRPDFYYMRYQSDIVEQDLVAFEAELLQVLRQVVLWDAGEFHFKNPAACNLGGYDCRFLPICSRGDRSGFVKRTQPFPELVTGSEAE